VAEHRELMGERMPTAMVGQDAGHADDYSNDQDNQAENDEHDALLKLSEYGDEGEWGHAEKRGVGLVSEAG